MKGPGVLRRLLGRRRHEPWGTDGGSATAESALDLADIQGFILRGYRMPMVRHFLLTVGTPAQARRQLGRLVSGDESDVPQITTGRGLARGVRARTGRRSGGRPASQARLLPQHRCHVARTGGARDGGTRPSAVVQVIWCVHRRSRATSGVGRRNWAKLARELDCRFWKRARSRPGDAARHQPGSDERLQRQDARLVCRRKCLPRNLAPRRDGANGDAKRPTRAHCQSSLRIYRRNQLTPTIRGGPEQYPPDHQRPCEPWLFVLREDAENYVVPEPRELGLNGSFAVFKKVETDVVGFEDFLQSNKDKIDPELLAAKIWGDGATAFLSPCHRTPIAPREEYRPNR